MIIVSDPEQLEMDRQQGLQAARCNHGCDTNQQLMQRFGPETFGNHEATHVCFMLSENIKEYLLEHPSVLLNSKTYGLVDLAHNLLLEAYQILACESEFYGEVYGGEGI